MSNRLAQFRFRRASTLSSNINSEAIQIEETIPMSVKEIESAVQELANAFNKMDIKAVVTSMFGGVWKQLRGVSFTRTAHLDCASSWAAYP